jgi:amino acid adenylation domain-containing protein
VWGRSEQAHFRRPRPSRGFRRGWWQIRSLPAKVFGGEAPCPAVSDEHADVPGPTWEPHRGASMDVEQLLAELVARGVRIDARDGQLHLRAPRGTIDGELRARLRALKPALVAALARREDGSGASLPVPSGETPPGETVPLTGPQRQLCFVDRVEGRTGLELHLGLRLRGELDREALGEALAALVARHETLRTRFEEREGEPVQVVEEVGAWWSSDAKQGTDPWQGRPFVASLAKLGPSEHELCLRVHHVVCDGWSMSILLEDLGELYSAAREDRPPALPPLKTRASEVARELAAREQHGEFEARLAAWAARMAGAAPLELPVDRGRPRRASSAGASVTRILDAARWGPALDHARGEGATAFMLVAAALAVVLARWTGVRDLCFGLPYANRARAELEPLVAMLVDTSLLRVRLDEGLDFDTVLARVREASLASFEHADIPLDRLVARLRSEGGPAAGPGRPALPSVMLNFAGFDPPRPRFAGLEYELDARMPGSRFDLTVYAYPRGGALELQAAFRSELFEPETMAALLEQLARVIAAVPKRSQLAWTAIPLVEPREPELPATVRGPSLVASVASVSAERIAVEGVGGRLGYGELRRRTDALAGALERALAGSPSRRVAVLARRTPKLPVALFAAIRAGLCFVVLDLAYPPARLIEMLEVADPDAWLCLDGEPPAALAAALAELPRVREPEGTSVSSSPARRRAGPAYLAFTSGTSGRPQVVVGTLGPVEHFLAWYRGALAIDENDRFASLSGLGHDPCLRDLFGALVVGARVCLPPREPTDMGPELARWLAAAGVTILHLTPSLARFVAAGCEGTLPALRRVCFGGDRLRGADVRRWRELAPNAELFNFYGATETPQAIAVHRVVAADGDRPEVPIGAGIEGVELELETEAGPAAIGEIAEIIVRTPYLARGYLDDEARTRARFLPGSRYRTGDLGRRRHDGSVVCLGRVDDQLEIRGFRVEPAEVEAVIRAHTGTPAAVVARTGEDGERELVAWLVGVEVSALASLREAVAARLPRPMVPTRWGVIDALPLTANAKLDRRALVERELEAPPAVGRGEAPRTPLERALAGIWAELLGREEIGRHEDFFAIGGHSLLAVRVAVCVAERLGLELPVPALFEAPTLAGCARAIEARRVAELPQLRPLEPGELAPASFAQERIWLLEALDEDAPQLTITHGLRLSEAPDLDALDAALVALEARHEVLRTTFTFAEGRLFARLRPPRERVLERGLAEVGRFDLAAGPLWRARVWSVEGEPRLEIRLHHIAGEAGSVRILARDLVELYRAAREGRSPRLPELGCRYAEVAAWQRELAASPGWRRSLERRRERLAGLEPLELPLARPRPPRQGYRGAWAELELDASLERGIRERAAASSTTGFAVVLTALAAVLARWCGVGDLAIGSPVGLRPHPATRELVGPFLDLVCLRLDAGGDPSLGELLERTRAELRAAFADSQVPFEQVVQALYQAASGGDRPTRELGRTPVFQVLLNMVDVRETEGIWTRLGAERVVEEAPPARYDLAVYAVRHAEGLRLATLYDADLFDPEQIELLLEHLRASLTCVVEAPERRLSGLLLRRRDAEVDAPATASGETVAVFERFAAVARAHAEAIALDMGTRQISYAQLHAHAHAVARALGDRGGGHAFVRVGLLVDEDELMAAGMLGVLAAGVAYVPLDPRLPSAHLRELVEDAQLHALCCAARHEARARELAGGRELLILDALEPRAPIELGEDGAGSDPAAAERVAYLLYTSGSTGRPKGVVQSQANLLHHASAYAARLGLGPGDRLSLVSTHAFDAAVMDIYGALLSGATLCPFDLRGEALVELPEQLRARGVSVFHSTPTVFRHLIASLEASGEPEPLAGVRWVVLGGEEARREDAEALARWFGPRAQLINGLGPTECTLALQELVAEIPATGGLPVGAPVPGVRVVLETPVGEQPALYGLGEIVLESPHLALGYWRRPQQSAAAFSERRGRRRYRSGDLGRWLPGGRVAFAGRRGSFVKIRGHRVEPGAVEAKLRALPQVRAAAVDLRRRARDEVELVGFYVAARASAPEDPDRVKRALAAELPSWMIPAQLVPVAALPETATGKIDRRGLARMTQAIPARREPPSAAASSPRSEAEQQVWRIWAEVLGHTPAGIDADFFQSGGDSLGAARLVRALEAELGLRPSLAELFEGVSIAELARRLEGVASREGAQALGRARLRRLAEGSGERWVIVLPPGQRPASLEALAAELDRPLWALEPPSFGVSGSLPTIAAIVAEMLRVLDELPELARADFMLAGVSNGGLLAWMLARRLEALARPPRLLALLDSFLPRMLAARPWATRGEFDQLASFVHHVAGLADAHVELTCVSPGQRRRHALELILDRGASTSLAELEATYAHYVEHAGRVWRVLSELELHADERVGFERVLIAASGGNSRALGEAWRALASGLEVVAVPGTHLGMLEWPEVAALAEAMRGLARRSRRGSA